MTTPPDPGPAPPDPLTPRGWKRAALPAALVFLAAAMGGAGIGWGIPSDHRSWKGRPEFPGSRWASFHPDEAFCVTWGLQRFRGRPLDPWAYNWGGTGQILAAELAVRIVSWETPREKEIDPRRVVLVGRAFSLLGGFFCVLFLYGAGRAIEGPLTGFLAALFFLGTPAYVEMAGLFRPDMPAAAGAALALFGSAVYLRTGRIGWAVAVGAGAGFAGAFRLPNGAAAALLLPMLAATLRRHGAARASLHALACAAAGTAVYAALSHPLFLEAGAWPQFLSAMRRIGAEPEFLRRQGPAHLAEYAGHAMIAAAGPALPIVGYAALAWAAVRRRGDLAPSALGVVLFLAMLLGTTLVVVRYALPLILFLCLPAAALVRASRGSRTAFCALAALSLSITFLEGFNRASLRRQEDTRVVAARWLETLDEAEPVGILTAGSRYLIPRPRPDRCSFRTFGSDPKGVGDFRALYGAGVGHWVVNVLGERRLARHSEQEETARFVSDLRAGTTGDGLRWERVAAFRPRTFLPTLIPRSWVPVDFDFVSPEIEIHRRRKE